MALFLLTIKTILVHTDSFLALLISANRFSLDDWLRLCVQLFASSLMISIDFRLFLIAFDPWNIVLTSDRLTTLLPRT